MRAIFRLFLVVLPLSCLLAVLVFAVFATENRALVTTAKAPTSEDATRARALAKRAVTQLLNAKRPTDLSVGETDLDSVFALMNRAVSRLSGEARISPDGFGAALTFTLPKNPVRNFINVQFGLKPSSKGLELLPLSVGAFTVSGGTAAELLRYGMNILLEDNAGDQLLESVRRVDFDQNRALLRVEPVPGLKIQLKKLAKRMGDIRDEAALLGDPATIRVYYAKLVSMEGLGSGPNPVSLTRFLTPLFRLAQERGGDAVVENRAALLAMVIYFGDPRFERLTGPVRTGALKGHRRRIKAVRLGGRGDLLLHFVISAGLQVVSDHGVAMAIGEFKELLDSARGGSGFSFVDIAADRTGLRFAKAATDKSGGARRLQSSFAKRVTEKDFFPQYGDLPEGLTDAQFKSRFGSVEDPRYKTVIREIDRRIETASVYLAR